jgi:hypothetical protein
VLYAGDGKNNDVSTARYSHFEQMLRKSSSDGFELEDFEVSALSCGGNLVMQRCAMTLSPLGSSETEQQR